MTSMKRMSIPAFGLGCLLALSTLGQAAPQSPQQSEHPRGTEVQAAPQYLSARFQDLKWEKIVPEFGEDSPEIVILRVDPKTQATSLMIRNKTKFHVPRHWHTANETHTILQGNVIFECDGKREELGTGSFNYIPSKMIHQAWLSEDGLYFITVDAAWDLNWVDGPPKPPQPAQMPSTR